MRGTWIDYGDVVLKNVLIKSWTQEAVYDDSDTDLRMHRHVITVAGVVVETAESNYWLPGRIPSTTVGAFVDADQNDLPDVSQRVTATQNLQRIRAILLTPRLRFLARMGLGPNGQDGQTETLLRVEPQPDRPGYDDGNGTKYDLRNGPKPRSCVVTRVLSNNAYHVDWTIEINVLACGSSDAVTGRATPVLTNRWSMTDDIDENFSTTRTINGRLTIGSSNVSPQMFRGLVVPRLQAGFRRSRMRFEASEDGLQLNYSLTDTEIGYAAPHPATSWTMRHTEDVGDGKMPITSCQVSLFGHRDTPHATLVLVALKVLQAKCWRNLKPDQYKIEDLRVTDIYGDSQHGIDASCTVKRTPGKEGVKDTDLQLIRIITTEVGKAIDQADLKQNPAYDRNLSHGAHPNEAIATEGPLPLTTAFAVYLQSPCSDLHALGVAEKPDSLDPTPADRGVESLSATVVATLPTEPETQIADGHFDFPYMHYEVTSKYLTEDHTVALPIAAQMPASSSSSTAGDGFGAMLTQAFVMLAPPTSRRILRVFAERLGKSPDLPEFPRSYDVKTATGSSSKAHRLSQVIAPHTPERQANGSFLWTIAAEAVYGLEIVADAQVLESLPIGPLPWLANTLNNAVLGKAAIGGTQTINSVLGLNGQPLQ